MSRVMTGVEAITIAAQSPGGGGGSPSVGGVRFRKSLRMVMKAKERQRRLQSRVSGGTTPVRANAGGTDAAPTRKKGTYRAKEHGKDPKRPCSCICGGKYKNPACLRSHLSYVNSGRSSNPRGIGSYASKKNARRSKPTRVTASGATGPSTSSLFYSGWGLPGPGSFGGSGDSGSKLGWFSSTSPFDGGSDKEGKEPALEHFRKEMEDEEGGAGLKRRGNDGANEWRVLEAGSGRVPFRVFRGGVRPGPPGAGTKKRDRDSGSRDDAGAARDGGRKRGDHAGGPCYIDFENDDDLDYFFDKMKVSKEMPEDDSDDEQGAGAGPLVPAVPKGPPPRKRSEETVKTGRGRRVKSTPRKLTVVVLPPEEVDVVYENVTPPPGSRQTTPPAEQPSASGLDDDAELDDDDIQVIQDFGMTQTD